MRFRAAGGVFFVVVALLLPAEALADHQIAEAVRASGEPLATPDGRQQATSEFLAQIEATPGSLELVGHSRC